VYASGRLDLAIIIHQFKPLGRYLSYAAWYICAKLTGRCVMVTCNDAVAVDGVDYHGDRIQGIWTI
jgi:hypothetical protein